MRDFFPDLPKLETQVQYIEAMDRNNTQRLSELRSKVISKSIQNYYIFTQFILFSKSFS